MDQMKYIVMEQLINQYNYTGALAFIQKENYDRTNSLLLACKDSMNFDFQSAYYQLLEVEDDHFHKRLQYLKNNLKDLREGKPDAIFSELIENTKIQLQNEKYIDFLSRVYRLKEAILKYIFAIHHVEKDKFSFMSDVASKRMILKVLKRKYKIYNPNLSFSITAYIHKHLSKDKRYIEALEVINDPKMNEIIEMRHDCIAGHGFKGVNKKDIIKVYKDPYFILEDFCHVLEKIGLRISQNKYNKINRHILITFSKEDL
ncbi:hypothetical protein [Inediibacterium massiliense]|uniref:hypothetical protein n=1 Tax=Inediibacterium massiliense TaxID=1658111 RepID=UPI0006B57F8B|nr:hypothetical protein [Inediibacterium massiliense]